MSNRDAASSAGVMPGVPGSNGLILGEILGSKAGDTWTEPERFLLDRGASWGVFRDVGPVDPGASRGLGLAEAAPEGLGNTGESKG